MPVGIRTEPPANWESIVPVESYAEPKAGGDGGPCGFVATNERAKLYSYSWLFREKVHENANIGVKSE